ncbi:YeeE/YedE thiosulfate transporter family protein [Desulfobulbus alkaliphilus]|uniref:YeeE/YedE thiosulfate transporter family protein n=1 Tax=Desulfobulbus alkaliphilus TaxID=869814 RepID=UPI001966C140|nr:YeeE/YedE thiosulfate transporter family protein [Desulfobulbus alkaliphilus]MBM9536764.1 YeeE/YedE family protein [Desulfobulbus alkaliphilus]
MEDLKILWQKIKDLYRAFCQDEWNPILTGIVVAILTILIMAWWRPWGAVGAVRNWGDWMLYGVGLYGPDRFVDNFGDPILTQSILFNTGSVIGIGLIVGAFISACLGGQFALRFPPIREYVKAMIAGVLMGVGAALAAGCNVGGIYSAIGNLAANGFAMFIGIIPGVLLGLWLLYKEMEHVSWGSGGSYTLEIPYVVQGILGLAGLIGIIWLANSYVNFSGDSWYMDHITSLSGIILLATGIGYAMQRGRWCMVQGFREPHMTGDCKMAKSVAISIAIVAVGAVVLKYSVEARLLGEPVLNPMHYVRGTFGWGGVVGGFIFGLGAMLAGGCGSGTLWRVGEGQIKLWLVVPFFALSNSLMIAWFSHYQFEQKGYLGRYVYLPDVMGYGYTLALILGFCLVWTLIVSWNEDSNKLLLPM